MYRASKVQKSKNRFVRADMLFAELASDFGGELVVGGGPFREPPTVMQSTVNKAQVDHANDPLPPSTTVKHTQSTQCRIHVLQFSLHHS